MTTQEALKQVAEAHTNLNMFGAIVALAESGNFYGARPHKALSRIVTICQAEIRKELGVHDQAAAVLTHN